VRNIKRLRLSPPLASESRRIHSDARTANTPIRASGRHAIPRVRARGDGAIRGRHRGTDAMRRQGWRHTVVFFVFNILPCGIDRFGRPPAPLIAAAPRARRRKRCCFMHQWLSPDCVKGCGESGQSSHFHSLEKKR